VEELTMTTLTREPGLKAQMTAGLIAIGTYALQTFLDIAPDDPMGQAMAPMLAYIAAQVVGWLWSRRQTTPTASPALPEGQSVLLPDGTAGEVTRT
jgi:hypothetical protein